MVYVTRHLIAQTFRQIYVADKSLFAAELCGNGSKIGVVALESADAPADEARLYFVNAQFVQAREHCAEVVKSGVCPERGFVFAPDLVLYLRRVVFFAETFSEED